MSDTREHVMQMWRSITRARRMGNTLALAEQAANRGEMDSPWDFNGHHETIQDYEVNLDFPISLYLRKMYEGYGGKRVLRVVDAFTSHTDPLNSLTNGILGQNGLPQGSIRGFAFGLSFMGTPEERVSARENGIQFSEGNIFDPSTQLFQQLDLWREASYQGTIVEDTIDAVVCRLGAGDVTFRDIPPLLLHQLLGGFYERSSPHALFIFQFPARLSDEDLQSYLHVLEADFGIEHIYREPFRVSEEQSNPYGRSVVLIRNPQSTLHWPKFKEVLEQMAA